MLNRQAFRQRVIVLCRAADPFADGNHPTQADLARALGFSRTELSRRLSGSGDVALSCDNARAIILQLATWGALQSQAEALELLDLISCPPFTTKDWQLPPLDRLSPLDPLAQVRLGQPAHNLPAPLSSFIGRQLELTTCRQILTNSRLLTITGGGGVGKSRLAVELGRDRYAHYATGVWLVKLAPLTNPSLLSGVVAATLGLREEAGRDITQTLRDYLRPRNLLLILDNCEHLLASVTELSEHLLTNCPSLSIIATSRHPLALAGESRLRLPPLSTPDLQPSLTPTLLMDYEAVQLFIARARAVSPSFRLTNQNAVAVAQICTRLDGIPLALELAAAQVEGISVEKLAQRLDDELTLLTGDLSTAAPHQQTLRASIEWSYTLLTPLQRTLLQRLSVFAGGWTLESAEAICADPILPLASPNPQSPTHNLKSVAVLPDLIQLVNKSLVIATADEPMRYSLLETIRQFAAEKLWASGEAAEVNRLHAALYLTLAETAAPELNGAKQAQWLARLEVEHDNLRAALTWALANNVAAATRLVNAVWRFWYMHGYLSEGRSWLATTLEKSDSAPSPIRAKLLNAAGWLAWSQGDYPAAQSLLDASMVMAVAVDDEETQAKVLSNLGVLAWNLADYNTAERLLTQSLTLRQAQGDWWGATVSLNNLGIIAAERGDYAAAGSLYAQCLAIQRQQSDKYGVAASLNNLAAVALYQADYPAARSYAEECLILSRELGDNDGIALTLLNLASAAHLQGNYARANELFSECLLLMRQLGDRTGIAQTLSGMANVAYTQGNLAHAAALHHESLLIAQALNYRLGVAVALEGLANVAVAQEQAERGTQLFAAAAALRDVINTPLHPADLSQHEHGVALLRQRLGEATFNRLWEAGQQLDLAAAIAYALSAKVLVL